MHHMRDVTGTLRHVPAHTLEAWLGVEQVARVSKSMKDFYWPVPLHGVPGRVYCMPGGDFVGPVNVGTEMSAIGRAMESVARYRREQRGRVAQNHIMHDHALRSRMDRRAHAFASVDALVQAATGGKGQNMFFVKTGVASNAIGNCIDLWTALTSQPTAGSAGGAAPGGTSPTNATAGAMPWVNPANANTGHFVSGWVTASVINNTLLLYDRLFAVAKTMNSTANEAVSGTFARYQSATATNGDYAGGNFLFMSVPTTVLAGTAHNWVAGGAGNGGCTYTDEAGNTAQNLPQIAGVSACVLRGLDMAPAFWFAPLAAGDVGVKALTKMECSALVATGTVDFCVGHPIAFMPCPIANIVCPMDGLYTALNLTPIYDNACLSFLEMPKPATTATTYSGQVLAVAE